MTPAPDHPTARLAIQGCITASLVPACPECYQQTLREPGGFYAPMLRRCECCAAVSEVHIDDDGAWVISRWRRP